MQRLTARLADIGARKWSLRSLLVAIALILTVPPLLLEAVLLYRYAAIERERAEAELEEDAKGAANLIDAKFAAAEDVLRVLAASPLLASGDLTGFEVLLRRVSRENGRPFVLVAPDGMQAINTFAQPGAALPRSDTSRWAPAISERRSFVTDVFRGALTGEVTVAIAHPIILEGVLRWTLNVSLYGKDFEDVLAAPGVPRHWIVSIVDRQGVHLVRSHGNDRFAGRPLVPAMVEHLRAKQIGTVQTKTLEGIPVISTTARAQRSGWAVAIGRPVAELKTPLDRQFVVCS